jgi:hypothetical protein
MYLKGFTADQYIRFNLKENNIKDYISEFERKKSRDINGAYYKILDNKYVFGELICKYIRVPVTYAHSRYGKVCGLGGSNIDNDSVFSFIKQKGCVVIKPVTSGDGQGVSMISYDGKNWFIDNRQTEEEHLSTFLKGYESAIISEFMEQSAFSKSLFPKSTNTIRIITSRTTDGEYEILAAVQRIGNEISAPTDNLSRGGIVAQIDMDTGVLGMATQFHTVSENKQIFFDKHPDTGEPIKGKQIPRWDELKRTVLETASKLYYLSYIAWDILLLDDGFCVIEGNASSGLNLFQVWGGQRNGPIGQAYKRFGIIK